MISRLPALLVVLLGFGLVATPALGASKSKATAPVELTLSALDPILAGSPVRIRLHAVPKVDAPDLELVWSLPADVAVVAGPVTSRAPARAGEGVDLTVSVRLPDLSGRRLYGGATFRWPSGMRQVKTEMLVLPSGAAGKAEATLPIGHDGRGRPIVEHLVEPPPSSGGPNR